MTINRGVFLIVGLLTGMLPGMSRAGEPLQLVDSVDLESYQGRWYEIARLPNRFQRHCVGDVSADYVLREDGRIEVTNRCRKVDGGWSEARGVARRADPDGSKAVLEVRFAPRWLSWLPFVWGDYRIIALGKDYDHALVGSENRRYLWILARSPRMADSDRNRLVEIAQDQGFDTDSLIDTIHSDE